MLSWGDVTVDGGDNGRVLSGGLVLFRALTGFDRNGLGNVDLDMVAVDGGGDGVEVVDRKVGPNNCSGDSVSIAPSCRSRGAISIGRVTRCGETLRGWGWARGGDGNAARVGEDAASAGAVGKKSLYSTVPFLKHSGSLL